MIFNYLKYFLISATTLNVLSTMEATQNTVEDVFTEFYEKGLWGKDEEGEGNSGWGSLEKNTRSYRTILTNILRDYHITSVVDLGCGDWTFSKLIDWDGIEYIGFDVVPQVIEKNITKYSTSSINFICTDGLTYDLPAADLLICKDVLQHLSNEDVFLFLSHLKKYKYCLITNDCDPDVVRCKNINILTGGYRNIDMTLPPYNLRGREYLYSINRIQRNAPKMIKQVLFIDNTRCPD